MTAIEFTIYLPASDILLWWLFFVSSFIVLRLAWRLIPIVGG